MVDDKIIIKEDYYITSKEIIKNFLEKFPDAKNKKLTIGIGGESGSGKSVTAMCIQKTLHNFGIRSLILHQDDYFIYPPATNHKLRLEDLKNVGEHEVKLVQIHNNILQFLNNENEITKPIIHYKANLILEEILEIENIDILIIEGTYIMTMPDLNYKVFMQRNYMDTYEQRKQRGRDEESEFVEQVLALEHEIISPQICFADIVVKKNYSVEVKK